MTVLASVQEHVGNTIAAFSQFEKAAAGRNLPWLKKLRGDGLARFCETGFPTTRVEDWRFTDVSAIAQTEFRLPGRRGVAVLERQLAAYRIEGALCRLVFVNGYFAPELSSAGKLPEGIVAGSLARQISENPEAIEPYLGRYLQIQRDPFCALNTAFLEDGGYVRIGRGKVCEAPIHLLFVSTGEVGGDKAGEVGREKAGGGARLMTHPRNLIIAEEGAEVSVVEDYISLDEGVALSNTATEAIAQDGAILSHFMIERENTRSFNISTLRIEQGRDTNVASHSVLTGGGLVRNNVHPVLHGEGGECLINGLFIGTGRQHLDNYMLVEHASPHCGSRQFYNGILDDRAHGVFHGRIVVHKDAQKTDAKQTNRNLLLSDDAQIDTKPQLEIFADDVKCTHGATIGQLDENALFYLRSRAIDEVSARRLLLRAFAGECLERMKEGPARRYVESLIHRHIERLAVPGERAAGAGATSERFQAEAR